MEDKEKLPFQIVIRERDRFKIEIKYLDTKFFIPVDFDLVENDFKLFDKLLAEHCKRKGIPQIDGEKLQHAELQEVYQNFDSDLKEKYRVQTEEEKQNLDDPRVKTEIQHSYISHNYDAFNLIRNYEKQHKTKAFKYVTQQQMVDIYVNGTLKKDEIVFNIVSATDGYLEPLEFAAMADEFEKLRAAGLETATDSETLGKV